MTQEFEKRYISKDGKRRITIYREEYADNPRDNTDEPLHCCDWSNKYSIKVNNDPSYSDARSLLNQMIVWYGKRDKIIGMLIENGKHMTDGKMTCDNSLVYDRKMKRWVLMEFGRAFDSKEFKWEEAEYFDGRKDDIDLGTLIEACLDSTIDELCYFKYWTDGIKMCSYGFGYYGEVSFNDEVSCDSEGIAWLDKDEFLKYSGCDPKSRWDGKTLKEIEWLTDELERYGDGDVYGFKYEQAVKVITNKRYPNGEHDDSEEETIEWDEKDSCWGFYEELDKMLECVIDHVGGSVDDYTEE